MNIELTPKNAPEGLPFNMYVWDFLHIIFGLDKYADSTPVKAKCDWGQELAMMNITDL